MRNYAREFFWGAPPEDSAEKKLVLKLDSVILSYCCLAYFTNYLDRANLANAYVSGMREDVNFQGNDYTYANSCFTAGYVFGQVPSALVLASGRIPPRYWFPFCCFAWGVLTLGLACKLPASSGEGFLLFGFYNLSKKRMNEENHERVIRLDDGLHVEEEKLISP